MSRGGLHPPQNVQSPSHLHAQANHIGQNGAPPPRSGPTPHQQPPLSSYANQNLGSQFPFQMNPGTASGVGVGVAGGSQQQPLNNPMVSQLMPPPLEKTRFEAAYKNFCASKGLKHDSRLLNMDGRHIDLFLLHTHVMQEGGVDKVSISPIF